MAKKQATKSSSQLKPIKRILKGSEKVYHDRFRLKPMSTIKYFGIHKPNFKSGNLDPVEYRAVEHAHWFYTADSNGRKHDKCVSANNHFHFIDVEKDDNGEIISVKCSKPMMYKKNPRGGKEIVEYPNDDHVHDIEYYASEEVVKRVYNQEALKSMSNDMAANSPEGVTEQDLI